MLAEGSRGPTSLRETDLAPANEGTRQQRHGLTGKEPSMKGRAREGSRKEVPAGMESNERNGSRGLQQVLRMGDFAAHSKRPEETVPMRQRGERERR
uniref:Uncharacterized protein n=1 Tax=Sphaerodactylus townsendi TaxID=933632 RepID=A0ACB8F8A2_9SAUR